MTEYSYWPLDTTPPSYLQTSALYAVKRELAMRERYPKTFPQAEPPYIILDQLKIFTAYYIHNNFPFSTSDQTPALVTNRNYHFPQGNNHAFILRVKLWYPEAFVILTPETIKKLTKQGLITTNDNSYQLEISFSSNKDIILANKSNLKRYLERRWDLREESDITLWSQGVWRV